MQHRSGRGREGEPSDIALGQMQQELMEAVAQLRALIDREEEIRRSLPPACERAA